MKILLTSMLMSVLPLSRAAYGEVPAAATVTQLADTFMRSYEKRFPIGLIQAGLPLRSQADIDINSPAELVSWRTLVHSIHQQLTAVSEADLLEQPEWVTWVYLRQAIVQEESNETCRVELWDISPWGWAFRLSILADSQPVSSPQERREALTRWRKISDWIDQDAANLAQGLRGGYSGYAGAVQAEIEQVDALLALPIEQWPSMIVAHRAVDSQFQQQMQQLTVGSLVPAAQRFRDFLQAEYLPKARRISSITRQPHGAACLRSRLQSATTVDIEPGRMFDRVIEIRRQEHDRALELGKQVYGEAQMTWADLARTVRDDPRNRFHDTREMQSSIEAVVARARTALPQMVLSPPSGAIRIQAFPDYKAISAPPGQFIQGTDDGHREPAFFYRAIPERLPRASLECLVLHQTIPGYYLQSALFSEQQRQHLHPVARIVFAEGPTLGWATYAERWAQELGLYSSAFSQLGSILFAATPDAIADLGMQLKAWSVERAVSYLQDELPLSTPQQIRVLVSNMASDPGWEGSFPIGALEYQDAKRRAQHALGARFDSRAFHQMLLRDGALPFAAMNSKVDRWIRAQSRFN
jgi:uncharacterized protein (DUF885 family)